MIPQQEQIEYLDEEEQKLAQEEMQIEMFLLDTEVEETRIPEEELGNLYIAY